MSNIESLINFSIKHHAKIKKLCAPLYETFGITNFWCAKTNFDGSHVAIESNIDYFDYYYSEKIYRFNPVFENLNH